VDVRLLNLQVVHQLDHVLCSSGTARLRFVAFTVIAIVDRNHAMRFRQCRSDAGCEPHPLGGIRVAVNQHDPRTGRPRGQIVDFDAV
jgi:hypothetical protein